MRFLVDAQLPAALARWLVSQGHEAEHVADRGLAQASDDEIWRCADRIGAVIVSKDRDFARRKIAATDGPAVVWVRFPNTRRTEVLRRFALVWPDVVISLARGEALVEIVAPKTS